MVEESKYCCDVMKQNFNKELVMNKEDNDNFNKSIKCWTCENDYVDNDIKVRDRCRITWKHRGSAHRDCNINPKLNSKILVVSCRFWSYCARTRWIKSLNKCYTKRIRTIFEFCYQ